MPDRLIYRISHKNINEIKFTEPQNFQWIRLDTNLSCNLHCLYCHNDRTTKLIAKEDFIKFIDTQVSAVQNFQIGCAMEPTMDKRLTEFAEIISKSKAKPRETFRLQTNAILLHRHDLSKLKESGINLFTISLDTTDPVIHKELRGGSDIVRILNNVTDLRNNWPEVEIKFVTTVNRQNLHTLEDLIQYSIANKINGIEFRRMFYEPNSEVIQDHKKMQEILLDNQTFLDYVTPLKEKYKNNIKLNLNDEVHLTKSKIETKS